MSAGPHSVLVVDDDPDTRTLVAEALESDGYDVRAEQSGDDALRWMAVHRPAVAIVDLFMPGMSGEDVCAAIRSNPDLAGTRILVLSGAEDTRIVAASCDADGAVTKPFTLSLLKHEVRRLFGS